MTAHGFVHDLDEATYHSDRDSLSVSGAKVLLDQGPAAFAYQREHRVERDVFDFGHAAHALVLGVGAPIRVIDADSWRTKDAQSQKAAARAAGETPLLVADHERVKAMADRLSSHTLAMRLLSEGRPEVSAYAIHEPTGVLRRCRFDWLGPSVLADYKSTASAVTPAALSGRYGTVRKFGYDRQAAWYTDVARALGHPADLFAFVVQAKEAPYEVCVATVRDDDLYEARADNDRALALFAECTTTGHWPAYTPDDHIAVLSLTDPYLTTTERVA